MSAITRTLTRSTLPLLLVLCLAALSVSYAFADEAPRPLATQIIGDPDAAVTGKFAVGTATPGNKALTVVGVIDFLGAGTVHNYFTQGAGNNMQVNTNVDEANTVGDATKSKWKLVLGSSLDWFSVRRSPAGGTYNEDALFFIEGSTGRVGIATVDTNNAAAIPFTLQARLHVQATSGQAIRGVTTATTGSNISVWGETFSTAGVGTLGWARATSGLTYGAYGQSDSTGGSGVFGWTTATDGVNNGVWGQSESTDGRGVYGSAEASAGYASGVLGETHSVSGRGVWGRALATGGSGVGVYGQSDSTYHSYGVVGYSSATTLGPAGVSYGVFGESEAPNGRGVAGYASAMGTVNYGVYGYTDSASGYGVYSDGDLYAYGDFTATGTKAAVVETRDFGWRNLYAVESPQNWFEDFGEATLSGGEAVVSIEPIFAQTVNLADGYHVFLTPLGECALYVAEKSLGSFTVRALEGGECEIAFDYRIIAPRLGYSGLRLREAEDPQAMAAGLLHVPLDSP